MAKRAKRKSNGLHKGAIPQGQHSAQDICKTACEFVASHIYHTAAQYLVDHKDEDETTVNRVANAVIAGVDSWVGVPHVSPLAMRQYAFKGDIVDKAKLLCAAGVKFGAFQVHLGTSDQDPTQFMLRIECPVVIEEQPDRPTDRLVIAKG